jgi:acetyl/propionyl-CoA carboxylase alpha subunit/acetyl-CoA carboxylase carboxyltransferase component
MPSPALVRGREVDGAERGRVIMSSGSGRLFQSLLIANRGEIAVRIARAATEMGLRSVAVYSQDDDASLHRLAATEAVALSASGPAAYLDGAALIAAARATGCEAIHPGYGFLSENAAFATACIEAGLTFVGPTPAAMALFGDKARARAFAREHSVPVPQGTDGPTSLEAAARFLAGLPAGSALMIKAIAGGGGRGMRIVRRAEDLADAHARCRSEAQTAFGLPDVYVERLVESARHIEVQVVADALRVLDLGERDCSVQRRHQKLVEIAPSPWLTDGQRERIVQAALAMARAARFTGLGTFEFLVDRGVAAGCDDFVFIEANPRLQVEHTVTEEITGIDLVQTQLALARGATLDALGITGREAARPAGFAVQFRVNIETLPAGGHPGHPDERDAGRLSRFEVPTGRGVRIDTFGYGGFAPSRRFDALLAKVIVSNRSPKLADTLDRAVRALDEFRIAGLPTNLRLLRNLAADPALRDGEVSTTYVDRHLADLCRADRQPGGGRVDDGSARRAFFEAARPEATAGPAPVPASAADPDVVAAPLHGTLIELSVSVGDLVRPGDQVAVLEAMKMEHVVSAAAGGRVRERLAGVGELLAHGQAILRLEVDEAVERSARSRDDHDHDTSPGPALRESMRLHALALDTGRPAAVARRHASGLRTARENLLDLCDAGSFFEYGALALAARHRDNSRETLQAISPADGFVCGIATVNAQLFGADAARCMVASYDYTVYAGTQGAMGHKKNDRLFQLALEARAPVVIFCEGGGGRPTDTDILGGANLANPTFVSFARLSALVPLVGIVAGRCFAGNAALLGLCDVVIATRGASIGMGGPVMIEGAGLGVVAPDEVGPAPMHAKSGVVDVLVADEAEAVAVARRYLAYFQGPLADWRVHPQLALRNAIPQRRTRAYDVRHVIDVLCDVDSVLELRRGFGRALVTALARVEGRTIGVIANDPAHQAGAIGADESDKMTRFLQLCDAFDLPVVSLCDCPGIMVGREAETTGLVRHSSRILLTGANIDIPYFTIVVRKAYGLGAMAMARGSFHLGSFFTVAWPTAEFGGMGLEGQVRLGHRAELEAIADPAARKARYEELVDALYQKGKATNVAPFLSIDDVIDPAASRDWLVAGLRTRCRRQAGARTDKKRASIDAW